MTIDRDKVLKRVAEYVYFLLDNEPKGEADAAAYDSRRRKLHDAIAKIMGVKPEDFKDTHIADGIKDMGVPVEDFIDFHTDRVITKVHNDRNSYSMGCQGAHSTHNQTQQEAHPGPHQGG